MKNRIYIYIFLLVFFLVGLTGCQKVKTITGEELIEYAYNISKGDIKDAVIIDLRKLENAQDEDDYDHGHIHASLNFDQTLHAISEFGPWIKGLKNTKTTIILLDSGNGEYKNIQKELENAGYKHIVIYMDGYQKLKEIASFKTKIEESTGTEDCGC